MGGDHVEKASCSTKGIVTFVLGFNSCTKLSILTQNLVRSCRWDIFSLALQNGVSNLFHWFGWYPKAFCKANYDAFLNVRCHGSRNILLALAAVDAPQRKQGDC